MQFVIEVLSVSKGTQPTKTGKTMEYLEVAYKRDGKVEGKKLFRPFAKEVCAALDNASTGQKYTITAEKEGEYWQWKAASTGDSGQSASSGSSASSSTSSGAQKSPVKGEWETKEERAQRQVMIVKQSSLANAIATLKAETAVDPENVIAVAQRYTDWVLGNDQPKGFSAIADMEDDIPL